MPQGTGTTVKEVAGVDPEGKTNIRKVDFLARSVIQVRLKLKCLSLLFAQLLIVLNKPSRRSFLDALASLESMLESQWVSE